MAVRIVLVGAGGHGHVVAEILRAEAREGRAVETAGYIDDDPTLRGRVLFGGRVHGTIGDRAGCAYDRLIITIGDNMRRRALFLELAGAGEWFATAQHPRAILAEGVTVEAGTVICAGVIVGVGARIGKNVILNTGCSIDHHSTIGDHVHVAPGVRMGGGVEVGQGSLVGIGAVVLPGVSIGAEAVVGAGSVVTRDVPAAAVVAGVPARPLLRARVGGLR